ncbi:MAG: hypothetical protein HWN67_00115 [Candidatus Helarchaeota archaeon]|nr:hypothetical protein [Candidatus Helarchaeota archaeon]
MAIDILWIIGFVEAKGCFTIPLQKVSTSKKKYSFEYINSLEKNDIIREIIRDGKLDYYTREKIKELSLEELKNLLIQIKFHSPKISYYFPRPTFFLTFNENDLQVVNQIKTYFKKLGINMNGPYETNKGKNLRLELKGVKNCFKLYELLSKQKWYTSKKEIFEKWGHKIIEIIQKKQLK